MSVASAMATAEVEYRHAVIESAWGHLAPTKNRKYRGHIVFAFGCYGDDHLNPTILSCELGGLSDSPWFFGAVRDFLWTVKGEAGNVYRWDGTFRNYVFAGAVRQLALT